MFAMFGKSNAGTVTLLAGLLALLAVVSTARAQTGPLLDATVIDSYLQQQLEELRIPGLGLTVVVGDEVVLARGYGRADPDGRPVTAQTPFMIGSTSKSFTALAVMQLVEAGLLELDAPVQTYLPWFRVADAEAGARITVRQLLEQTSGFSIRTGREGLADSDLGEGAMEAVVRALGDEALAHPPGERHEYSNVNYDVLGMLIQTASGQSYESYVAERIFGPLEMDHASTSHTAAVEDGLARGHLSWFGLPFARAFDFNRGHLASGHLMVAAEDMGHYLVAQLNQGRYRATRLLSPEGMAELQRPAVATEAPGVSYGLGWYLGTLDGEPAIYHGGDNLNYSAYLLMLPEEQLGVGVMINVNGIAFAGAAEQIATGVMAAVRGQQPQPYRAPVAMTRVIGSVVVPAAVALLWVVGSAIWFARRRTRPGVLGILLPLVVDLGLLWVLLFGIPTLWQLPLEPLLLMFPDMATLILGSAAALAAWALLRTGLSLRPRTPARAPRTSRERAPG